MSLPQLFAVSLASLMIQLTSAIPIDNGIVGIPQVECGEQNVRIIFNTQRPFGGRIFVKGMVDRQECVTTYPNNGGASSMVFQLNGGTCNMRRQRRLGPQRGVEQSMTVIVSFHDTFITKVDKAYRCTCFYMEADKIVTNRFDVSMLPTTDLFDTARMPVCTYSVHRGSTNGDLVSYARVGDEIYHVWQCNSDMFGMLVHSCFVDDGTGGGRFQLLDESGCAIDPVILPDLTYNGDTNMAYVEAHAFKFADKQTTYFQCAISLCMKADGACNGVTPPRCSTRNTQFIGGFTATRYPDNYQVDSRPVQGAAQGSQQPIRPPPPNNQPTYDPRFRRGEQQQQQGTSTKRVLNQTQGSTATSAPATGNTRRIRVLREATDFSMTDEIDVAADPIMMIDVDDFQRQKAAFDSQQNIYEERIEGPPGAAFGLSQPPPNFDGAYSPAHNQRQSAQVCMSALGFGSLLAVFMMTLTASLVVTAVHWQRHKQTMLLKM